MNTKKKIYVLSSCLAVILILTVAIFAAGGGGTVNETVTESAENRVDETVPSITQSNEEPSVPVPDTEINNDSAETLPTSVLLKSFLNGKCLSDSMAIYEREENQKDINDFLFHYVKLMLDEQPSEAVEFLKNNFEYLNADSSNPLYAETLTIYDDYSIIEDALSCRESIGSDAMYYSASYLTNPFGYLLFVLSQEDYYLAEADMDGYFLHPYTNRVNYIEAKTIEQAENNKSISSLSPGIRYTYQYLIQTENEEEYNVYIGENEDGRLSLLTIQPVTLNESILHLLVRDMKQTGLYN